jgi:uncharacterized protein YbbK (DUF523 family)
MLTPATYPGDERLLALPTDPLRVMVSACLAGAAVIDDGSARLTNDLVLKLMAQPNVEAIAYCPEDVAMGTPRTVPNCDGGNGYDVLDGRTRFTGHDGTDHTTAIVQAANIMASRAVAHGAHLAILTHISGTCGTSVIYDGHRDRKRYQHGPGVAAAALIRAGVLVIAQADYRALRLVLSRVIPGWLAPEGMPEINLWEQEWYQTYFKNVSKL